MSQSKHKQFRRLARSLAKGMKAGAKYDPVLVAQQALGDNSPTIRRLRSRTLCRADPRGTTTVWRTGFGGFQRLQVVVGSPLDKQAGPMTNKDGKPRRGPRYVSGGGSRR